MLIISGLLLRLANEREFIYNREIYTDILREFTYSVSKRLFDPDDIEPPTPPQKKEETNTFDAHLIAGRINRKLAQELDKIIQLFTYFDPKDDTILRRLDSLDNLTENCSRVISPDAGFSCLPGQDIPNGCIAYCDFINRGRSEEVFLGEMFEMASKTNNRHGGYLCSWEHDQEHNCWSTIVNDLGLCVTNFHINNGRTKLL